MSKEAEINKELIKILKDKILLLEEQKVNSREIINAQKEQLILSGVSQQRELLIEAFDLINIHDGDREKITKLVDITLKSINC